MHILYSDIEALIAEGLTDAQIAAVLSTITVKSIAIAEVENLFDFEGLARRDAITGDWSGPLPTIAQTDGHPLQAGLVALFRHINKPRSTQIDTTQRPWCVDAANLLGGLIQTGDITADQRTAFYALGGDLKFGEVIASQVAAVKAAEPVRAWFAAKISVVEEGLHDGTITTNAQVRTVLETD